jgi:lysylphosphatidylglycerol synthetase-like protein (DUF2156 family)
MILVYPLLLVAAVLLAVRAARSGRRRTGPRWFAAWVVAGFAFTFSLVTGFSIGLLLLPLAAVLLLLVASRAPGPAETLGFVAGIGLVLLLFPIPLAAVAAVVVAPVLLYTAATVGRPRRGHG